MKSWKQKILFFLATLGTTIAVGIPAAGCAGGCGSCFQCAGLGGTAIVLLALGTVGKKKQDGNNDAAAEPMKH